MAELVVDERSEMEESVNSPTATMVSRIMRLMVTTNAKPRR
jgi:hypothetical protein